MLLKIFHICCCLDVFIFFAWWHEKNAILIFEVFVALYMIETPGLIRHKLWMLGS